MGFFQKAKSAYKAAKQAVETVSNVTDSALEMAFDALPKPTSEPRPYTLGRKCIIENAMDCVADYAAREFGEYSSGNGAADSFARNGIAGLVGSLAEKVSYEAKGADKKKTKVNITYPAPQIDESGYSVSEDATTCADLVLQKPAPLAKPDKRIQSELIPSLSLLLNNALEHTAGLYELAETHTSTPPALPVYEKSDAEQIGLFGALGSLVSYVKTATTQTPIDKLGYKELQMLMNLNIPQSRVLAKRFIEEGALPSPEKIGNVAEYREALKTYDNCMRKAWQIQSYLFLSTGARPDWKLNIWHKTFEQIQEEREQWGATNGSKSVSNRGSPKLMLSFLSIDTAENCRTRLTTNGKERKYLRLRARGAVKETLAEQESIGAQSGTNMRGIEHHLNIPTKAEMGLPDDDVRLTIGSDGNVKTVVNGSDATAKEGQSTPEAAKHYRNLPTNAERGLPDDEIQLTALDGCLTTVANGSDAAAVETSSNPAPTKISSGMERWLNPW